MKKILTVLLLFILSINVFTQPAKKNLLYEDAFYINFIATPSDNNDSVDVFIFYSFYYNNLVFQKTSDNKYFATPEIEATFKDNEGITRKRFISNDTIFVNNYEQTQEKICYSNATQFSLTNDNYKIVSKINNSKHRSNVIEYAISKFSNENKLNNFFILNNNFNPFFSNNAVPFDAFSFFIFIPTKFPNADYYCKIEKMENKKNELNWKTYNKIEKKVDINKNLKFEINGNDLKLVTTENETNHFFLVTEINMLLDNFTPGKYSITIINNNYEKQFEFEIKWYNMPKSLLEPMFAVEQMYIILTDEEYKKIKTGNKNEIFNNILNYWKQHDPTPTTEYNEAMTEFFDRVDYAEINFRTLTQKEGAKSDRGKIYILNGKPDEIITNIKNKKTNEIWKYKNLNKKYTFEIVSVGNYKLVNIEE